MGNNVTSIDTKNAEDPVSAELKEKGFENVDLLGKRAVFEDFLECRFYPECCFSKCTQRCCDVYIFRHPDKNWLIRLCIYHYSEAKKLWPELGDGETYKLDTSTMDMKKANVTEPGIQRFTIDDAIRMELMKIEDAKSHPTTCTKNECKECSMRDCPLGLFFHYKDKGCPCGYKLNRN
jgi:hypothetical protein